MWDHQLFLWLNFDGGVAMDNIMLFISGKLSWIPLYIFALFMIWRKWGIHSAAVILLAILIAVGFSDIFAGVFKKTGLLGDLPLDFEARIRPMFHPRMLGQVHFVNLGGKYGTISAHAATSLSIALICALAVSRRWFTYVMLSYAVLVAYSRIYLGYHFPQDILLGWLVALASVAIAWGLFKYVNPKITK